MLSYPLTNLTSVLQYLFLPDPDKTWHTKILHLITFEIVYDIMIMDADNKGQISIKHFRPRNLIEEILQIIYGIAGVFQINNFWVRG